MTQPKKPRRSHTGKNRIQMNVSVTEETRALLEAIRERDGVPYSAQIERALRLWAEQEKGIEVPHARKGGG